MPEAETGQVDRAAGGLLRWAEVDRGALRHNASLVRERLQPDVQLLVMVKSDGYGHGAITAARAAIAGGATWLGVYTPDEAMGLRRAGLDQPLLVVGWSPPATLAELVVQGVDVTALDAVDVVAVRSAASLAGKRARVHVKVDTGMGRLGVRAEGLQDVVDALRGASDHIEVAGLFTHLADPERNPEFTQEQHRGFLDAVERLRPVAPHALLHACGSNALLMFPAMHHDIVRLGIALYGYPAPEAPAIGLRPAMSVFARVVQVKTVRAGDTVGYRRSWSAPSSRRIATVAFGYGQGLPRSLSNRGSLVVGGCRCPIVGIVNMDQVTVDVSEAPPTVAGDVAMVFGEHDGVRLAADEVAGLAGTIPHELLCGVSAQVPRVVVGDAEPGG